MNVFDSVGKSLLLDRNSEESDFVYASRLLEKLAQTYKKVNPEGWVCMDRDSPTQEYRLETINGTAWIYRSNAHWVYHARKNDLTVVCNGHASSLESAMQIASLTIS